MRKRALGETGIEVTELALGTWGLSGDAYGPVTPEDQDLVIERALALGIEVFETADSYGRGEMEKRLGERLAEHPNAVIVTKVGTDRDARPARKRFDRGFIESSVERSRERLKREVIDVVLLHNPSLKAVEREDGAVDALRSLKESKKIRAWGVSIGAVDVGKAALARGAEVLELAYNAFHRSELVGLTDEIREKKPGILARSVLAHGLLVGHWPSTKQFARNDHRKDRWTPDELRKRIQQLSALRPAVTGTIPNLRAAALRFVLANDLVSAAVVGPRNALQIDQLVREAGSAPYFTPEALTALENRLETVGIR